RSAMRVAIHLRAYLPLYVMAIGFVLLAALLPTVNKTSTGPGGLASGDLGANGAPAAGGADAGAPGAAGAPAAAGANGALAGGRAGAGTGGVTPGAGSVPVAPGVAKPQVGAGTTRGGFPCPPSNRQLPWTQ